MKYSKAFFIVGILLSLTNCPGGMAIGPMVECDIVGDTLKDVSTDVTIEICNWDELVKASGEDIPISSLSFCGNICIYDESENLYFRYNEHLAPLLKEFTIDEKTIIVKIPPKSTSGTLFVLSKEANTPGYTKKSLTINYPQLLTLSSNKAKAGDKITITSTNAFFIDESFTKEKLSKYLEVNYYIVWVESDLINTNDLNNNHEKKPVEKEYYLIDKITPTSVSFLVPPYAKTGKVHIINEAGFSYPNNENYPNSPAYFSTAIELEIVE